MLIIGPRGEIQLSKPYEDVPPACRANCGPFQASGRAYIIGGPEVRSFAQWAHPSLFTDDTEQKCDEF